MKLKKDTTLSMFEWAYDRQSTYRNKEAGLPRDQWTDDLIISRYYTCNVYRELDKVSQYIINTICDSDLNPEDKFLNIYLGRMFVLDGMYDSDFLGISTVDTFDAKVYEDRIVQLERQYYQNVYRVCPPSWSQAGMNTLQGRLHTAQRLIEGMKDGSIDLSKLHTLPDGNACIKYLDKVCPLGGPLFIGQVFLDCGYTDLTPYTGDDWATCGPGAYRGVQYLIGEDQVNWKMGNGKAHLGVPFIHIIHANQHKFWKILKDETGKDWQDVCLDTARYPTDRRGHLSLMDIQNCLCEFRKYVNHQEGNHGKTRYYR